MRKNKKEKKGLSKVTNEKKKTKKKYKRIKQQQIPTIEQHDNGNPNKSIMSKIVRELM